MNEYEKDMLEKIDSKVKFSEKDLSYLVSEFNVIKNTYGDNRRWSRSVTSIIEIGERFFKVDWEEGLTECQENEFYYQPKEVEKKTYKKTIIVTEWIEKAV